MQRIIAASTIGLALALGACSSDPEETPDITEAIPLDVDQEGEASAAGAGEDRLSDGVELSAGTADGGTQALPNASGADIGNEATGAERNLPDTMEAGSNPPKFEPPKGSKVQRFN